MVRVILTIVLRGDGEIECVQDRQASRGVLRPQTITLGARSEAASPRPARSSSCP